MALFGELAYALISTPRSRFARFIPDVVVRETYRDSLIITDHPVERGAPITDHAFKRPKMFEMECGFSNSSAGAEGYIESIYEQMVQLQELREPFTIFTPRRMYKDMLAGDIIVSRDDKTNSVLACALQFRQIILTRTQSATASNANQADPASTASISEAGSRQPVEDTSFANGFSTAGYDVNALGETVPSDGGSFPNIPADAPAPLDPDLVFSAPPDVGSPTFPGTPNTSPSYGTYSPFPSFSTSAGNAPFVP